MSPSRPRRAPRRRPGAALLAALCALAALDAARSLGARALISSQRPAFAAAAGTLPPAPPAAAGADPAHGRYLVESGLCGHCHTPIGSDAAPIASLRLAGGTRFVAWPFGVYVSGNLTPDAQTGVGRLSVAELAYAIRSGHTPDRTLDPVLMPSVIYASYSAEAARDVAAYLLSLPPVHNAAPAPLRYGAVETILGKLLFFAGVLPACERIAVGSFGRASHAPAGAERLLRLLPDLELLLVGAIALLAVGSLRRRPLAAAALAGLALPALGISWLVYRFPALPGVPATTLRARLFPEPALDVAWLGPEGAAIAERGRSVYFTSGCAVCHGMDGAEPLGLRWSDFGSVQTANLTPHASGLGGASDAEIELALRAGRTRDGRVMHWRAMPWPQFAQLSEGDTSALIAFLRALPAVACARPAPQPPAPGDPPDLTLSFSARSACRR